MTRVLSALAVMATGGLVLAGLLLGGLVLSRPALAQSMGLDGLHEQRREGGRICMIDHFHHGSSYGLPTRKQAEVAAGRDWAGFTAWEYDLRWGNYAIAANKTMACSQSTSGWGCEVDARPCRPGRK